MILQQDSAASMCIICAGCLNLDLAKTDDYTVHIFSCPHAMTETMDMMEESDSEVDDDDDKAVD